MLTRGGSDLLGVVRRARPASAVRWVTRLGARAPEAIRYRSLRVADSAWQRHGARFRTPSGRSLQLPGDLTAGAREMYCRNVYLRTGLAVPPGGWVLDLGANAGLFTVLAAVEGARVVAVEAQRGFATEIARLLAVNGVDDGRVRIEIALAGGAASYDPAGSGAGGVDRGADTDGGADADAPLIGVLADDERWRHASHADRDRPPTRSVPELLRRHGIDRVGLLKLDIEGSEFSVLRPGSGLSWLARVDQLAMEVHPRFGDVPTLSDTLAGSGFTVRVTDDDGRPVLPGSAGVAYLYCHR